MPSASGNNFQEEVGSFVFQEIINIMRDLLAAFYVKNLVIFCVSIVNCVINRARIYMY